MDNPSEYNQSFTAMVRRHEKIIFSVCFFYATTDVGFDDLRQEVLISLFKAYRHFRKDSSESTWVYKVALNTCLFSLRRLTPKVRMLSFEEMPYIQFEDDSEHDIQNRLEWLYSSISRLKPIDKALVLMWLDELSYDEIAENMGIPRNTVASRLHRIKRKTLNKINMELEDLKKTWKSVEPHIEKASTGTSDIPDLESKTDYKTRLLRRCIISLTISVVSFPLVVTSRLWAPMLFPISWLVSFGIVGIIAIMAEIYLINMIRKVSISEFSISEIMKATLKIKKYYKNIELIFSVVFAILMGWLVFLPPFLGNWRMVLVVIAIVITSIIELRLYNKNITLINRLSGSEYSDIN